MRTRALTRRCVEVVAQLLQIELEIGDRLITLEFIFRQCFRHDAIELSWHVRNVLHEWHRIVIDDREARVTVGASFERRFAGDHFVKLYPEPECDRTRLYPLALRLCGSHDTR